MHRRIDMRAGVVGQSNRQGLRGEHRVAGVFLLRVIAPDRDDDRRMRRMGLSAVEQFTAKVDEFHAVAPLRASCAAMLHSRAKREEATMATLSDILETTSFEKVAGGFVFTEGPLWHPDGFFYFVDVRSSVLYRITLGQAPEVVRRETGEGNGTTFDLQGRLIICEGGN